MENEIIHEFKPIENNYHKGSKDWKKIERKNKKRKIGYDIKKTILLLDALKEQERRIALGM